jgi:hypothetical protein
MRNRAKMIFFHIYWSEVFHCSVDQQWSTKQQLIYLPALRSQGQSHVRNELQHVCTNFFNSWDSAVGIATGYWLDHRGVGVRVPRGSRIFSSRRLRDWLCGPLKLNFLSNGYWELFSRGLSRRSMKLTTHLQLVTKSRKYGSIHPLPHTHSWRTA